MDTFMMKTALHLPILLMLAAVAPSSALAQDMAPYQSLEVRHVCTAQAMRVTPGGAEALMVETGEQVVLVDVTYAADEIAWFALNYATGRGLERATGYLPVEEVRHFCGDPARVEFASDSRLQSYIAPPNTCHLVLGYADTVDALNVQASSALDFAAVMSSYRLQSGGYALTAGLLSTEVADRLPNGSTCVSGADFAEALIYDGSSFALADNSASENRAARLLSAQDLLANGRKLQDPQAMKQACDLGLGAACTGFADLIYDEPDGADRGPAVVTRYSLLGCLAGDLYGCQMAVNRLDNTLEFARTQALAGTSESTGRVTTELSKLLCDEQDRFGCILLARGTAPDRPASLVEAASNFAANLTACKQGIAWICEELASNFDRVVQARGSGLSGDERFAIAGIETELCTMGARELNQRSCVRAYYSYRDFLQYGTHANLDADRVAKAVSVLTDGCSAGDPPACGTMAAMPDYWSVSDRRQATASAIALCSVQDQKDSICDSLDSILDPTFSETRSLLRPRYERLAQSCRTPGNGAYQDCIWALHSYAALEAPDGLTTAEAMLNEACSPANSNGCQALAQLYGKSGHDYGGITIPGRDEPKAYMAVLRMGCREGNQDAGNTCSQLADALAMAGDDENPLSVLAEACVSLMDGQGGQDAWACYDAAKMALTQNAQLEDALVWANFVCEGDDISTAPYACKLVGNILAEGLGLPADPSGALLGYQRGCFHPRVSTTDGEACLNYGNMLIETVRQNEMPTQPLVFAHREDGEDAEPSLVLAEASRAFDMGCMDGIAQACRASERLLEEWSTGDLPFDAFTCQVRSAVGEVVSERPCRGLVIYQAADEMKQSREQIGLNVYVWPDGDRSVTYIKDGVWRLNEIRTDYPTREGATTCWHNPISTRSFCVTPATGPNLGSM
ncbi:hypothetical protein N8A98_01645 (plasmid) [Devosia neptuniae]|uniref:Beta-lactamase n=1 Tax=Devosia neptuniae TaxID=191302 RepID=A0ABY6C669_9HYPH|nr:hypothetical protein [Devosia neptuniae]UXN67792.1 hypothetical protein N8A98_01645 [Devosia neptuniae]